MPGRRRLKSARRKADRSRETKQKNRGKKLTNAKMNQAEAQ
jgi:hypothetical protein